MAELKNIGDKILFGNPEDIKNLKVLELHDVYEVGPRETYFEVHEYNLGSSHSGNCGRL